MTERFIVPAIQDHRIDMIWMLSVILQSGERMELII